MNQFKIVLLIVVSGCLYINAANRDTLPHPKLDCVEVEWWFPTYINPPKLHITLTTFEIGNMWKGITDTTPTTIRKEAGRKYSQIQNDLKLAKESIVNKQNFASLFPNDETYQVNGLDIISTHPDFANHFVLDTSSSNPSGIQEKFVKFKKIIDDGNPFQKEWIKAQKGLIEVPKYRWFLVAKLNNNFTNFRNKLCSNIAFSPFPQSTKFAYLPHVTLGRIENIEDLNVFMTLIKQINIRIANESIQRKSFKLKEIELYHPNNHKTYFLLETKGNSMFFMLTVGWKTALGKLLKNIVSTIAEQEKIAKEEVLKNSVNRFSQFYAELVSLESRRRQIRH